MCDLRTFVVEGPSAKATELEISIFTQQSSRDHIQTTKSSIFLIHCNVPSCLACFHSVLSTRIMQEPEIKAGEGLELEQIHNQNFVCCNSLYRSPCYFPNKMVA